MSDISIGRSGRTRSLIIGTLFICMGTAGLIGLESLPGVDVLYAPTGVKTDSAPDATTGQPLASVDRGKANDNGSARNSSEATPKTEPQTDVSASQINSEETPSSENNVDSVEVATLDWEPLSLDRSAKATEERLYQSVVYLASDELEGRGVRTRGLELAAQYIAEEYRNANLNVHHYADGPFHEFDLFSSSRKGYVQNMRLSAEVFQSDSLIRGADFTALMSSPQGRFSHSIAFAGYGISANEIGYDDYANLDVRGKAVIVLRHEPRRVAPVGDRTKREHSVHAYVHTKIENAIRHQAAAVILCTDHAWVRDAESADQIPSDNETAEPKESLLQTEIEDGDIPNGIPVVHVRREIVEQLVQDSLGTTLGELESTINSTGQPHSCELPHAEISGNVELVRSHKRLKNVVATLPAQGPRSEETIVIGAHYDHLGRDSWGSLSLNPNGAIHNGADDNASGTSVLLEVARQLAAREEPLKRKVLFIAFSAEELGLIGSKRYVQDPLVPLNKTLAMLNLDMVGRLRNEKLTVYGVETSTSWPNLLTSLKANGLTVSGKRGGFGPSDHASFYEHSVPVLHFFTGFHPEYHRPEDDFPLVNAEGMRLIADYVVEIVEKLSEVETIERTESRSSLLDYAELDQSDLYDPLRSPSKPRLGISAKAVQSPPGVQVVRVLTGGMADQNGLRSGDVITAINGQAIDSLELLKSIFEKEVTSEELAIRLSRSGVDAEIIIRKGS